MSLASLLEQYTSSPDGIRRAQLLPGAHRLERLTPGAQCVDGASNDGVPTVLVEEVPVEGSTEKLSEVMAQLKDHDVLLAVIRGSVTDLPVGPIVQVISDAGVRVVRAEPLEPPLAGTLIVLSRDTSVPRSSYLLGHALPDNTRFAARVANEWLIEGLHLRAVAAQSAYEARSQQAAREDAERRLAELQHRLRRLKRRNQRLRDQLESRGLRRFRRSRGRKRTTSR